MADGLTTTNADVHTRTAQRNEAERPATEAPTKTAPKTTPPPRAMPSAEVDARTQSQTDRLQRANTGLNGAPAKTAEPPMPSRGVGSHRGGPAKPPDNVTGAIVLAQRPDIAAREIAKRAGLSERQVHVTMTNLKDIHDKAYTMAKAQLTIWEKKGTPKIDGQEVKPRPGEAMEIAIRRQAYERVMANSVEGRENLDKMQRAWDAMSPAERQKVAPVSTNPYGSYMIRLIAEGKIAAW